MNTYTNKHKDTDPIFYSDQDDEGAYRESGWYFWDETWSDAVGPYATYERVKSALKLYAKNL